MYLFTNIHWHTEGLQCFHFVSFYFSLFLSITYLPRCITMTLKPSHPHLSILFSLSLSLSLTHTCTHTQTLTHALAHTCTLFIPDPHGHNISQRPMHFEKRGNIFLRQWCFYLSNKIDCGGRNVGSDLPTSGHDFKSHGRDLLSIGSFQAAAQVAQKRFSWFISL